MLSKRGELRFMASSIGPEKPVGKRTWYFADSDTMG
jgi:hypothetical protein